MKIIIGIILILTMAAVIHSCTGVSVGVGYGIGYTGGPYGWGGYPRVNVGVYGGGYWR